MRKDCCVNFVLGRLDALIVNHGTLNPVKRVADSTPKEWRSAFDVNVFSAVGLVSYFSYSTNQLMPELTLWGDFELVSCLSSRSSTMIFTSRHLTNSNQIQASLPLLRASRGRIILTSSGASLSAYQGWGAYGAGKAVLNHLALTLSVEEPDVTTISIRPGVVDTEMQREIREVHHESMSEKDRTKFAGLKKDGGLLRPEQPGHVIAKLAVADGKDIKELSGKFLNWNDESLSTYQED